MRKRFWVGAGAIAVVVAVVGWSGPDLERVSTADIGVDVPVATAVFDDSATDTAYVAFVADRALRVAKLRAGSDELLWNVRAGAEVASVELAVVDGVLLVLPDCPAGHVVLRTAAEGLYTGAVGVDLATGRVTWTVTGERDHLALVPGTSRLAHYAGTGTLRLLAVPTGRVEASVDVPAYRDGWNTELTASSEDVVLGFSGSTREYAVYSSTDLTNRWSMDERVYPLPPGHYYASDGATSRVIDERRAQVWTADGQVFRTSKETGWVYTETAEGDAYRIRYFDLATGRLLADDTNMIAHATADAVLQADKQGQPVHLWHVALPSGDRTDLGDLDVHREPCAFSATHIACLDAARKFGMWSYT